MKEFLKGGEAELYENVKIEWIRGREALMTIYEDEKELKKIKLYDYKKKEEMHELFRNEGFKKKSQAQLIKEHTAEKDIAQLEDSSLGDVMTVYYVIAALAIVSFFVTRKRSRKRKKKVGQQMVVSV